MSYRPPIELIYNEPTIDIKESIDGTIYSAVASVGINVDKLELIKALNYDREQYEKGEWDMFELLTSVIYGKQCYFVEDNGTVYSRLTNTYQPTKQAAINDFLDWYNREE